MLKGFYLTLLVGPFVPLPAPQSVVDALTAVQVTTSAGQRSGFQLTFALSKRSQLNRVLLPVGYFDPNIRVIIIVTVNGFPNVLMDGVITRQEVAPSNEPGQSTLTVTGEDLSLLMDLDDVELVYPGVPDAGIVELLIVKYASYGIVPVVVPPVFLDVPNPSDRLSTQVGTDLQFIQSLARDAGYVFYITPGPVAGANIAYWGPEVRIGVPQPALNVNMDSFTNAESLSFSFDGLAREQPVITVLDPITHKIPIPIPVPDVSLLRPPLAVRPAVALRKKELRNVAKVNPIRAALFGLSKAGESSDAITGSGQLDVLRYGRVLQARGLVGVRGAGMAYDGLYYVKSVTHDIKRGEYKQSFTLAREGLISLTPRVIP